MDLTDLLIACDLVSTGGQARRWIKQGAIKVNSLTIREANQIMPFDEDLTIRIGKQKELKCRLKRSKNDYIVIEVFRGTTVEGCSELCQLPGSK